MKKSPRKCPTCANKVGFYLLENYCRTHLEQKIKEWKSINRGYRMLRKMFKEANQHGIH